MAHRSLILAALLALGLGVAGCGLAAPDAGFVDAPPATRLERLVALDRRVAGVAWTLARANADLCPLTRPRAGWSLQSATQYGPELRALAEARYGLDGDLPGILAAPQDSPAATAGLSPGDLILSVNGQALARGDSARASYDGLEANIAVLDAAAARGPVSLRVRRAGVDREVRVSPVSACAYGTQIETTGTIRSRSDGRHVFISDGMVGITGDDDQLAFALAHELAHAVLEHQTDPGVTGVRGASNWAITLRRGLSLSAEGDADRMGLFLLARAGFDPDRSVAFLTRYAEADPGSRLGEFNLTGLYESPAARRRTLAPVLADIAARKAADRALIP